ncbi:F-box/kelch-repeat protein At3g06240-like [Mercurialis annua]|uniref:F-box/kelch-repeat protein At3g06240-like n=1 Tax=Mercurialis annua TaxID=3986 RepID=UPI0024AF9668|nr:F-box/kelch-repeat protein At3g06240-like [Mercurialis annua]
MLGFLPEEVVVQILSRLPVKSIFKFSCVSKLWNCIIKTPHFISAFSSHHYFLLHHSYYSNHHSLRFDNKHLDHYLSLHPPCTRTDTVHMVGSSNGLVCLYCTSRKNFLEFIIWNPSIRKSLTIPESSYRLPRSSFEIFFGFGFDSRTNDYKLLTFSADSITNVVLYSLNSNSWKKITNVPCKFRKYGCWLVIPAFIDGRFYWNVTVEEKNLVLVFDLRDGMFGVCLNVWNMFTGAWTKLATVGKRWRGSSKALEFRDNVTDSELPNLDSDYLLNTMKMKKSEYLPEEVVVQILSRLPVKSILKFRCVSKLWNFIIRTPHFISAFSSNNHHHYSNEDLDRYLSLHPPFNPPNTFRIVGSSNGLVCLLSLSQYPPIYYNQFILWNPAVRKSMLIPESTFCLLDLTSQRLFGFGFDSRTNDYKLLVARCLAHSITDVILYSLSSNSWKKITHVACKYRNDNYLLFAPSFVDGRFYWPIFDEKKNLVLVFDLRDEMFREISLPECLRYVDRACLQMIAFGESSIAVIHQDERDSSYESDIWVLKEYNSGAWMQLATVGKRCRGSSYVFEFGDNGEVLVQFYTEQSLASCNIKNGLIKNLMAFGRNFDKHFAYRHVESLALLDKANDTLIPHIEPST